MVEDLEERLGLDAPWLEAGQNGDVFGVIFAKLEHPFQIELDYVVQDILVQRDSDAERLLRLHLRKNAYFVPLDVDHAAGTPAEIFTRFDECAQVLTCHKALLLEVHIERR